MLYFRTSLKGWRCTVRSLRGQTVNMHHLHCNTKPILTKQTRVCSPAGIRVSKTEWTAQNRWMRYNSPSLAQSAGKPCLLILNLPRADPCLSKRAPRSHWISSNLSYSISEAQWTRSRIHDLHPDCALLENFSLCFNAVWLRIAVPLLMQMFSVSALCALVSVWSSAPEQPITAHTCAVRKSPGPLARGGSKHLPCKKLTNWQ